MWLLKLAVAHPDLICAFLVVVFQSIALLTRGKDHLSSPRGWLELAVWVLSMSAVILRGHSVLDTARLLDHLKHEAEQALKVSQKAQCEAKDALLNSQSASEEADDASKKADNAETDASIAEKLSKQAGEGALSSLKLAHAAQAEIEAQRRALRSVHIDLELSGPLLSGHVGSISGFGDNKEIPSVYLYSVAADAKDSDSFKFGGFNWTGTRGDNWNVSLRTELINRGFPVGEDIRTLNAYRSICVDLISQLGSVGLAIPTQPSAIVPMSVHITVEVNGRSMQQPASGLYASAHQLANGKSLYCVTIDKSLDDIYEKR